MHHIARKLIDSRILVDRGFSTPCWENSRGVNNCGYSSIRVDRKMMKQHRIAFLLFCGPFPEERPHTDHLCGNKRCFNPSHLEAVSNEENQNRRAMKRTTCRKCATPFLLPYQPGYRRNCFTCHPGSKEPYRKQSEKRREERREYMRSPAGRASRLKCLLKNTEKWKEEWDLTNRPPPPTTPPPPTKDNAK